MKRRTVLWVMLNTADLIGLLTPEIFHANSQFWPRKSFLYLAFGHVPPPSRPLPGICLNVGNAT